MNRGKRNRPKCLEEREDCFSYKDSKCNCLNNTYFPNGCPFYKTWDEFTFHDMLLIEKLNQEEDEENGDLICEE